jgi:hypothetical protein
MFKTYHFEFNAQSPSPFNWLGLCALILSVASIFFGFYFIFLTKRTELRKLKFEKFCINPLDKIFENLDDIFEKPTYISIYRQEITDSFLNIQVFIITLQKVYKNIPLQKIITISESFTDLIYNEKVNNLKTNELKGEYLSTKILVYNEFFEFGTTNVFTIIKKRKPK